MTASNHTSTRGQYSAIVDRVRISRRKRVRVGASITAGDRVQAQFPNHVWALDFVFHQTADGRLLKVLMISDEFTKTTLAIEVERPITGNHLVQVLDRLVVVHEPPMFIRMDNGPCRRSLNTDHASRGAGSDGGRNT